MKLGKKQKKELTHIIAGAVLYVLAFVLTFIFDDMPVFANIALFVPSYAILGFPIIKKAAVNLTHGNMLDENFLMSIASIGAFCLVKCSEGVAVMLFDRVGQFFEDYAVGRSRKNIGDLLSMCPDYANIYRDGDLVQVDPTEISAGETVVVLPGERVPLDGVITSGETAFDTSALTGESVPVNARKGDRAVSGYINKSGKIEVLVEREYANSTVAKIAELIEQSTEAKSKSENLVTRFAKVYTPIVVCCALALAVIPTAAHLIAPEVVVYGFTEWLYRALLFLVVSCPCALVISVPLSFFGGIGEASRRGVLIKGSNYIEMLAKADTFVFDKTGTLTYGTFTVTDVETRNCEREELLRLAAAAERYSTHPIAQAIYASYTGTLPDAQISESAGKGVCAVVEGKTVLVGNAKLLRENGVVFNVPSTEKTAVYIAIDGKYAGAVYISDTVRESSAPTVAALNRDGSTVMLSGDNETVARSVAAQIGVETVYAGLLPQDKVEYLKKLRDGHVCAFCGDGMNDAPVLALADVGIAMGGVGSDAAIEASDVVIMDDDPSKILTARAVSKKTVRIVHENIIFSLAVKIGLMILGALGIANMWSAVFGDVGVLILAVINAMRTSRVKVK